MGTWSPSQVTEKNLVNMASRELYPGDRLISVGFLPKIKREEYAGRPFMRDIVPAFGHRVVKVAPGGVSWRFLVLSELDESMQVIYEKEMNS